MCTSRAQCSKHFNEPIALHTDTGDKTMFASIARRIFTVVAVAFVAASAQAASTTGANGTVNASFNAGYSTTVCANIISSATVTAGAVSGSFHIQTTGGVLDSNYSTLSITTN